MLVVAGVALDVDVNDMVDAANGGLLAQCVEDDEEVAGGGPRVRRVEDDSVGDGEEGGAANGEAGSKRAGCCIGVVDELPASPSGL